MLKKKNTHLFENKITDNSVQCITKHDNIEPLVIKDVRTAMPITRPFNLGSYNIVKEDGLFLMIFGRPDYIPKLSQT